jgi:ABC-type bacteriocin/lantibiotic exporter with double-glycine peptidase domain
VDKTSKMVDFKYFICLNCLFYFQFLVDSLLAYNLENTLHILSIRFVILSIFNVLLNALRNQLLMYLAQKIDIPLMH